MATVTSPYYRGGGAIQNLPYWPCKFKGQEVHYDNKDFCLTIPELMRIVLFWDV